MCRFVETNRGETVGGGGAFPQLSGGVNQSQLLLQSSKFFIESLKDLKDSARSGD